MNSRIEWSELAVLNTLSTSSRFTERILSFTQRTNIFAGSEGGSILFEWGVVWSIHRSVRLLSICTIPQSRGECIGGENKHRKCDTKLNYVQRFRCMSRMEDTSATNRKTVPGLSLRMKFPLPAVTFSNCFIQMFVRWTASFDPIANPSICLYHVSPQVCLRLWLLWTWAQ